MQKFKDILLIVAGVALFIAGIVLRYLLDRRRVSGAIGQPGSVGSDLDGAGNANSITSTAVDNSASLNNDIQQANSASQRILQRSRDILEKAKNRSSGTG